MKIIIPDCRYPEGPLWFDGKPHCVEYAGDRVVGTAGATRYPLWHEAGAGPAALIDAGDGTLWVMAYDANAIIRIDRAGRTLARVDRDEAGRSFIGPNDGTADGKGGFYFSASGRFEPAAPSEGCILHRDASGRIRRLTDGIRYANGVALADEGRTLLVAETLNARILAFDIGADGTLARRRIWRDLAEIAPDPPERNAYYGPDGIKVDGQGRVLIALFGGGAVLLADRAGTLVRRIDVPARYVTNVNFGASERELLITALHDPWRPPYSGALHGESIA